MVGFIQLAIKSVLLKASWTFLEKEHRGLTLGSAKENNISFREGQCWIYIYIEKVPRTL